MKILFVCMGNICRSPSAQGVFEKILKNKNINDKVIVDSAGTHGYHIGAKPDSRSIKAALNRDIDIRHQRSRKITIQDFEENDYVIVMDDNNHMHLKMLFPLKHHSKIFKMMKFSPSSNHLEVPDPYYGGKQGFERVLDLLEKACLGLYQHIINENQLKN